MSFGKLVDCISSAELCVDKLHMEDFDIISKCFLNKLPSDDFFDYEGTKSRISSYNN